MRGCLVHTSLNFARAVTDSSFQESKMFIDELIVIVYIRDFPRMRTDWLAKTLVTVT